MLYFDTSFLAPLILEEPTSLTVERFMAGLPDGALAVSQWTRVEFSSLLAREVRMGGLELESAKRAGAEFEAVVRESFVVLTPTVDDFNLAKAYLGRPMTGLRAGDALHLAIASRPGIEMIYTFDRTMLKAGEALGLRVGRTT